MSGGLPPWIIVLLCWSIAFQSTTWTSSLMPVFAWYFFANSVQNALVLVLEYSAATSLMELGFPATVSAVWSAPVPPVQAVIPSDSAPRLTASVDSLMKTLSGERGLDSSSPADRPAKWGIRFDRQRSRRNGSRWSTGRLGGRG